MAQHVVFVTWKAGTADAFAAARRLGHRVSLVRSLQMERLQHLDFAGSAHAGFVDEVCTLPDATEPGALDECIRQLHARSPIDGFVATVDALVVPVARIAEQLGIPFTSSQGAGTAKHKGDCRAALAAAGIDRTECAVVADADQAAEFAARVGYPIVLKPVRGSASEGAHVIADQAELHTVFAGIEHRLDGESDDRVYGAGVLVERYLTGRFLSAEVGLAHGRFLPLAVSERKTWSRHEPLEIGTTIPAAISDSDRTVVLDFAERVVDALDLRLGIFHVEIMLGADGAAHLIEFNPRIMGSCLPNLFRLATGTDLFELLVRIHLDEPVQPPQVEFTGSATVRWFGAAEPDQPTPPEQPELGWSAAYRPALHSLSVRLPDTATLPACRGNLDSFGEVQVIHPDHATSVRIAEEIVERVALQLGTELTR